MFTYSIGFITQYFVLNLVLPNLTRGLSPSVFFNRVLPSFFLYWVFRDTKCEPEQKEAAKFNSGSILGCNRLKKNENKRRHNEKKEGKRKETVRLLRYENKWLLIYAVSDRFGFLRVGRDETSKWILLLAPKTDRKKTKKKTKNGRENGSSSYNMLSMCPSSIVSLNRNNGVDVVGQSEPFKRLVMTSLKPTNRNCRSVSHIRDACIITLFFFVSLR